MKRRLIRTKAGQLTWLQVLALAISGVAYLMGSLTTAVVMLVVATVFGVAAAVIRVREAQQINRQKAANPRKR